MQYGWQNGGSFLVGPREYAATGARPADGARARDRHFALRGSLDAWTNEADKLCAPGLEAAQFALLCAPASVLLKLCEDGAGAETFSMTAKQSGPAKSLALDASASFWGDMPALEIKTTSAPALFWFNHSLPAYFDEAAQRDGDEMARFLSSFADGDALILVCASHGSLIDLLRTAEGRGEAMTYRVLEAHPALPDHMPKDAAAKIAKTLKKNSGQAGDRFLRYLLEIPGVLDYARIRLKTAQALITQRGNLDNEKAQHWARLIAAVDTAGELVRACDVLHCNPAKMREWGIEQAKAQLGDSGVRCPNAVLVEYLAESVSDIITVSGPWRARKTLKAEVLYAPMRDPRGRFEVSVNRLFLSSPLFRRWIDYKGYPWRATLEEMRDTGVLYESKLMTLTAGTGIGSADIKRQQECLCLATDFLGFRFDRRNQVNMIKAFVPKQPPKDPEGGRPTRAQAAVRRAQRSPESSP
ncbi:MAG: DUF927 domain-containing protein [Kiritimatiellia bacterium]